MIDWILALGIVFGAFAGGFIEGWALARSQYRDGLRRMYASAGLTPPPRLKRWSKPW